MKPLILTLRLNEREAAFFDGLRRANFPPERNHVGAHLTIWFCRIKRKAVDEIDDRGCIATMIEALRKVIERLHYPLEVMLTCVRWYVAYPLSFRHIEEMMGERGVVVDHATVHRWSLKILPVLAKVLRHRKRSVGRSWRMDETYIKVRGHWRYLYRAVDREGDTVDFLLTAHRDEAAARRFLERAIDRHGKPKTITIDKSGANTAAIDSYNKDHKARIGLRQCKYLNNIVEQDHRAIKRITRPMLGFKSFRCARILLVGIETMNMIRKGQLAGASRFVSAADQFYALAY